MFLFPSSFFCQASLFLVMNQALPVQDFQQRFVKAASSGFSRWDKDGDGFIGLRESTRAIADKTNRGDEAAAVATLHEILRRTDWPVNAISLEQVRDSVRRPSAFPPTDPPWELRFSTMAAAVNAPKGQLFGPGAPKIDGIRQGREGDCYLIASVGAMAERNPDRIRAFFKELPNNRFEIQFKGAIIQVEELTDAERALAATSGNQGSWMSLLEKGWGVVLQKIRRESFGNALDRAGGGGDPALVIRYLTGRKTISRQILLEDGAAEILRDLDYSLRSAMEEKRLVCATTDRRALPQGLVPTHAYAVLGYDPKTRLVTVWNPWGIDFEPAPGMGFKGGYETRKGRFNVALSDFIKIFDTVILESASRVGED